MSHMYAESSRAMAVVITVFFLPRWLRRLYRAVSLDYAFQAMSCISGGNFCKT